MLIALNTILMFQTKERKQKKPANRNIENIRQFYDTERAKES